MNKWARTGFVMRFPGFQNAVMAGFNIFYGFAVFLPAVRTHNPHTSIS